jgi:hypothetical protein
MATIVSLKDRRETGIHLLDALDRELKSMTAIVIAFEQIRRSITDFDTLSDALLAHYTAMQGLLRLALEVHDRTNSSA